MKTTTSQISLTTLILMVFMTISSCADKQETTSNESKAINVQVGSPIIPEGKGYFSASGQIQAGQFANISARTMGYISKIHVKVGDHVKKGQPLLNINNSNVEAKKAQAQAAMHQAKAKFIIAEKDYLRFEKLYSQNSASQKELDDVKLQYDISKAQVESALQVQNEINALLSYSNIIAPFSGVITSKSVHVGDMAKPGHELLSIEVPGNFVATALVSELNITHVKRGDTVKVYIKSNKVELSGIVDEVSTSSQHSGGQYLVKIKLTRLPQSGVLSGMFVSTIFSTDQPSQSRILIPRKALINKGELQGVYTVSASDTAILRWLKLGRVIGENVEVLSGMTEEERYILSSEGKLFNGVKLNLN